MEPTKSTSRYILTALAVILVVTAFVLVGLNALNLEQRFGVSLGEMKLGSNQSQEQYKQGYLAAREKYKTMCPMAERHGESLTGTVTQISGGKMTITQETFDTEEAIDGISDTRTVNILSTTKLQAQNAKPQDQLNKELAEFKPKPGSTPPSPYTLTAIKVEDIKPGDKVNIASDKDLRMAEEFSALTIYVIK